MRRSIIPSIILSLLVAGCSVEPEARDETDGGEDVEEGGGEEIQRSGYYVGQATGRHNPSARGTLYHDDGHLRGTLLFGDEGTYTAVLHIDADLESDEVIRAELRDPGCDDAAVCGIAREAATYEASGVYDADGFTLEAIWVKGNPEEPLGLVDSIDLALSPRDGFKPVEGSLEPTDELAVFSGRISSYVDLGEEATMTDGFCELRMNKPPGDGFWLADGTVDALLCDVEGREVTIQYEDVDPTIRHDESTLRFAARLPLGSARLVFIGGFEGYELTGVVVREGGAVDYWAADPIPDPTLVDDADVVGSFYFFQR